MQNIHAEKQKIIVVVGPTASGKTSLSIEIAKRFNGEIISADSRQVYRGMNLGTGKVTKEEMDGIPHHLLDIVDPMEIYNASDFTRDGRNAINDILGRKKLPIIAGGTFFYIDTLLGRVTSPKVKPNQKLRNELEEIDVEALYEILLKKDERRALAIDPHNKRRLIRALEIIETLGAVPQTDTKELYEVFTIGISTDKNTLRAHIRDRILDRIKLGMIEEVTQLHKEGVSWKRMDQFGLEYRHISQYLKKEVSKEQCIEDLTVKTRQFAKRQMTWLKRDKTINWFNLKNTEKIFDTVQDFLTKKD